MMIRRVLMNKKITVIYNNGKKVMVDINTKIIDIVKTLPGDIQKKIIGAKIDNRLTGLETKLKKDCTIDFIDKKDLAGYKMYQAGLKFIFLASVKDLYKNVKVSFDHSIMRGMHITLKTDRNLTTDDILQIKKQMNTLIAEDLPILKMNVLSKEMVEYYNKIGDLACSANILNVDYELVNIYRLEKYYAYFYMEMPYSTGCCGDFDLALLNSKELALLFLDENAANQVPTYINYEKVIECFRNEKAWLSKLNVSYAYQVNEVVADGKINDLIRLSELNFDNKIHKVCDDIVLKGSRFVMIAGPSSSGKTTTCKKIALDLQSRGIKTIALSVDDYFKNRADTPKLPNGDYDFESLEAIDVSGLNRDINLLLAGEKVKLPTYNFVLGVREYLQKEISINDNYVILMEGLHCLNDSLMPKIDNNLKYKIYLSPFMPLNIDNNNYISTTDLRLIRRIIRDNRMRGHDVSKTIATWKTVRDGEEKYIFPYISTSNVIINTSLVYELGVLKVFAEPLLYSVRTDSKYYEEARRLINFLKSYFPISSEYIRDDCVLREFIGGSCFDK